MEEYKKLKPKLTEETYKELELFWINNLNLNNKQADKFISLIEKIHLQSKEVRKKHIAVND